MNTQEIISTFVDTANKAYKRNSKGSKEASMLDRHLPVTIDDITFTCWREYTMYRMAEYIQEKLPAATVELELNGNESKLELELTDEQQRKLNSVMYIFLKENNAL